MSELNGDRAAWLRCYRCWSQSLEIQIHYDAIRRVEIVLCKGDFPSRSDRPRADVPPATDDYTGTFEPIDSRDLIL